MNSIAIHWLEIIAEATQGLELELVYVGGATLELYLEPVPFDMRITEDIDGVVEISSLGEYYALGEKLRRIGFTEAFSNRGKKDYYASKDLEDIISLLDGVAKLPQAILQAEEQVNIFIIRMAWKFCSAWRSTIYHCWSFISGSQPKFRSAFQGTH